jgi:hypothetical protein
MLTGMKKFEDYEIMLPHFPYPLLLHSALRNNL